MQFERYETAAAIRRLKQEIESLTREQSEALHWATAVGMTADEAKEYDERRQKILAYVQDLKMLEDSE
jgi:hypothetical protein